MLLLLWTSQVSGAVTQFRRSTMMCLNLGSLKCTPGKEGCARPLRLLAAAPPSPFAASCRPLPPCYLFAASPCSTEIKDQKLLGVCTDQLQARTARTPQLTPLFTPLHAVWQPCIHLAHSSVHTDLHTAGRHEDASRGDGRGQTLDVRDNLSRAQCSLPNACCCASLSPSPC